MEQISRVSDCRHCGNLSPQSVLFWHSYDESVIAYDGEPIAAPTLCFISECSICREPLLYTAFDDPDDDDLQRAFLSAILVWPERGIATASDRLLASAAEYLVEGHEEDAANVLLSCELEVWESGDTWWVGDEQHRALHVKLTGPRSAYDVLREESHEATEAIRHALEAVLPEKTYIKHFTPQAKLIDIGPEWREELLEIARGKGVHNQASDATRLWKGLRFRSASEIKIAEALEAIGVLFLPNCVARVNSPPNRVNREPDFLVCHAGKWGVLEVDGEPFHPPTRTTQDHQRDRLFRQHGIRIVEHYDARRCFEDPKHVVGEFLSLLEQA